MTQAIATREAVASDGHAGDQAKPLTVLFVHYGDEWMRGSETILLDLLRSLDPSRVKPVIWCNGTELAEACRAAGWQTHKSDLELYLDYDSPRFNPARYVRQVRTAIRIIDEERPAVIHANSAGPMQSVLPAALMRGLPCVVHLHIGYLARSRVVLMTNAATRVVGVSKQVLQGPLSDGLDQGVAQVIYNGIDVSRIPRSSRDLRGEMGIPRDAFVVATAGSLIHRKGHDVLIRAFANLRPDAAPHLVLSGGGPDEASLRDLAKALGLEGRFHMTGHTSDIAGVYQAADAFALASRDEAFGLVLAEAGYFGLPVCATAVGGIPEVVEDGVTGLLVPPDDPDAMAQALDRLMADGGLRDRMGAAARLRVETTFSSGGMARQFEALYESLDASRSRPGLSVIGKVVAPMMAVARRKLAPRGTAGQAN